MKHIGMNPLRRGGGTIGWAAAVVLVSATALLTVSCAPRRAAVVESRSVTVQQHTVPPPPTMTDISFIDMHPVPTSDPAQERVVGTIVNHGDRAVSRLSIRVEGLDDSGRVVSSVTTPPLDQTIDPLGGRAQFEAMMPRASTVTTYHAVAIAR